MEGPDAHKDSSRFWFLFLGAVASGTLLLILQAFQTAHGASLTTATYSRGFLRLTIPYNAEHRGEGKLILEVLDPKDVVLGRAEFIAAVKDGNGRWQEEIRLDKPMPLDELVWQRVRYRFEYSDGKYSPLEGTESVSQIIRMPVLHILGQQSYLTGGPAAIRVIVTDSNNDFIPGRSV